MEVKFTDRAEKTYTKLSLQIRTKTNRQFNRLLADFRHPSLRVRKVRGENKFEARIDYHYRFTFVIEEKILWILSIGPHDEGLGKK